METRQTTESKVEGEVIFSSEMPVLIHLFFAEVTAMTMLSTSNKEKIN